MKKNQSEKPDELRRQLWHHQGVQAAFIVVLILGSFILPKIPMLRGWEYKFTVAAVDIGKSDLPSGALRIQEAAEALKATPNLSLKIIPYLQLHGPIPVAAWPCEPLGFMGLCVRYLYKGMEPLTIVAAKSKKTGRAGKRPFTKSGWGGYLITTDFENMVIAITSPSDPVDIARVLNIPPSAPVVLTRSNP